MSSKWNSRAPLLAVAALAVSLAAAFPTQSVAKPQNVDVLGFSLTSSQRSLAEPGGALRPRNCRPKRVFAFVAVKNVRRGATLTWTWRLNGRLVTRYDRPWPHGGKPRVERVVLANSLGLPRGTYQIAVRVPGKGTATGKVKLACR